MARIRPVSTFKSLPTIDFMPHGIKEGEVRRVDHMPCPLVHMYRYPLVTVVEQAGRYPKH